MRDSTPLVMVDLFAGHGGASAAQAERGWRVHRVDTADRAGELFAPAGVVLHRADVREWRWAGGPVDLVWASVPCTEFARESMPWCRTGGAPSLDLLHAALARIEEMAPRWWCVENVRGAQPWFRSVLGEAVAHVGACYLWGRLPPVTWPRVAPHKERKSGQRPDLRSVVPYAVSMALADAVETQTKDLQSAAEGVE